jgi:hypothetical protein
MAAQDPSASASPDDSDTPAPGSAGGDLTQGYVIEVSVLPDGSFNVGAPEPLQEEAEEENGEETSDSGQSYPSIGAALKQVLLLIQENPVSGSADAQFQAGFSGGQGQ